MTVLDCSLLCICVSGKTVTKNQYIRWPVLALLLLGWALLLIGLSSRYYGLQEAFKVWVPAAVRNLSYYDFSEIGLLPTRNSAPTSPDELDVYTNHPPLLVYLPALLSNLTGFNEVTVRFVFVTCTWLSLVALYVLVRRLFGARMGFYALGLTLCLPMIFYFGRVVGHEAPGLLFLMLYAAVLVNWLRVPTRARYLALILLVWLCVWSAWPAVFFVAWLGLGAMLVGKRTHRIGVIGLGIGTVAAFVALMLFYEAQQPGAFNSLLDAFVWRSSTSVEFPGDPDFTPLQWLFVNSAHVLWYTSIGFSALAVWGVPLLWRQRKHTNLRPALLLTLMLLAAGLSYVLIFRNASFIHNYYKMFLVPAMAISAAAVWVYGYPNWRAPRWKRVYLRPLAQVLTLFGFAQAIVILYLMHLTGINPAYDAIIAHIDAQAPSDETIVIQLADGIRMNDEGRVVEFYTFRPVQWGLTFDEALAQYTDAPLRYITCQPGSWQIPDAWAAYEVLPLDDPRCVAVIRP